MPTMVPVNCPVISYDCIIFLCRESKEDYLKELTRDGTQLLLNKLWEV